MSIRPEFAGWCVLLTWNKVAARTGGGWTGSLVDPDGVVIRPGVRRSRTPEDAYRHAVHLLFRKFGTLQAWISPRSVRWSGWTGPAGPVGRLGEHGWIGWRPE